MTRQSKLARLQSEVALLTVRVTTLERALAWIQAGRGAPDGGAVRGELDGAVRASDEERDEPHRL